MKILVIRFSSIGDIVLTTPVIRCLKNQVPTAQIHYLTKYSFRKVLASNPYVDRFFYLDNNWKSLTEELKQQQYDLVIDLHHNLRTARLKKALKVKSVAFQKLNIEKWIYVNLKINRMPNVHIVDRYLETVRYLDVKNDGKGLDYFISPNEEVKQQDIPHSHIAGYIAVVIGAAHATKRMPAEILSELCKNIQHPIILLGGPEDRVAGDKISATDTIKIYNACGKFSLNESADLIRKSKFVISHDTGLMHIAAALKKPVISIWGNTVPAFGMTPYYGSQEIRSAVFEVSGLGCRPCSKIGHDACPKKHFKCMRLQDIQGIAALAEDWAKSIRL